MRAAHLGRHQPRYQLLREQHVAVHGLSSSRCHITVLELDEGVVLRLARLLVA